MTATEATEILKRHGFDGDIMTPSRYVEGNDIQWISYSNAAKGAKVCIYGSLPHWSDWQPIWEDAFNIAFATYLVAVRGG